MPMHKTPLLVNYFSPLVCSHQLYQQNLKFSFSLLHSGKSLQAIQAKNTAVRASSVNIRRAYYKDRGRADPTGATARDDSCEEGAPATSAKVEGRGKVRGQNLFGQCLNPFTSKRAESAGCSQVRIMLSYCPSATQSTPSILLLSIARIYGASVPTIYRQWKKEEHMGFATSK